jgi:hypothetical protein
VAQPAYEKVVAWRGVAIDDRELLDAVNRDDVDLAARLARHIRVDRTHSFLECLVQLFQCRDQALAGKV